MRTAALISCTLIAACATADPPTITPKVTGNCNGAGGKPNGADCSIPVKVTEEHGKCTVDLAAPGQRTVVFDAKGKWIRWTFDPAEGGSAPSGYVFAENTGVDFNADPLMGKADLGGNFKNSRNTGTDFYRKNRNELLDKGTYAYSINVRNSSGSITCDKDPWVRNE